MVSDGVVSQWCVRPWWCLAVLCLLTRGRHSGGGVASTSHHTKLYTTQTCPISLHITHYIPALSLNTLTVDRAASDRPQPGQTVLASHHNCIRHGEINRTFLADTSKLRQRRMMTCPGSIVGRGQSYWDRSSVLTSNDINVLTTTGPSEACRPLDGSQWFKINQRIVLTCKYFKCSSFSVNELLLTSNWI